MKKITLLASMFFVFALGVANAQTEIAPEKAKAIKELTTLVNTNNSAVDLAKMFTGQFSSLQAEIITSIIDDRKDLTPEERKQLEATLTESAKASAEKFQDKLFEKLDYNSMMDEIALTVYDKYYNLEEINNLIQFYKSPVGQKSLKVMQPLMVDSMQMTQARLMPKLMTVMQELREEEKQQIAKKADELKPRKPKTKGK